MAAEIAKSAGQQLYELYFNTMADEGVDCDNWSELWEVDQRVWEAVAAQVTFP